MKSRGTWLSLITVVSLVPVAVRAASSDAVVTVTPEETDEILANPGMGWQTFHRTSKADKNLPSWIPSTVHYARWGWRELEPQPGKIAYEFLDRVLKESHDSGQKLAFRVMCCSTTRGEPYHPAWLKDLGGRAGGRFAQSPIWTTLSSSVATSILSSGLASIMMGIPALTMLISARWAGGASGT